MRIDLNHASASQIAAEQNNKAAVSAKAAVDRDGDGDVDKTSFSSDQDAVSKLASQAMQTSPVRQDKVDALRQSIQNGEYKLDPGKIADAMIKDHSE